MKNKKLNNKKLKFGGLAVSSAAIVIAIVILLNVALNALDYAVDLSLDFSSSAVTEIDDVSTQILSRLTQDVEIIVNGDEKDFRKAAYETKKYTDENGKEVSTMVYSGKRFAAELLDCFRKGSDRISVDYVDPRYNPGYFKERNITLKEDVFVTVYCKATQKYSFIYNDVFDDSQYVSFERQLDAAVQNVTLRDVKKIGIIQGHNETEFPFFEKLMTLNAFDIDLSVDITKEEISEDVDILVIANPTISYSTEDIKNLRDFLYHNGDYDRSLVVFMDNTVPENPLLEDFLKNEWGIDYTENTVFDPSHSSTITDVYEPFLTVGYNDSNASTAIADILYTDNNPLKVSLGKTRALDIVFDSKNAVKTTPLLMTIGDGSFGKDYTTGKLEVTAENFKDIKKGANDTEGPHTIGAMSFIQKSSTLDDEYNVSMSSVVCFGTTSIIDNYYISNMAGYTSASSEYATGLFRYLSHDDSVVKIVSTPLTTGTLEFDSDRTVYVVALVCIAAVPLICAVTCIVVYRKRNYL